MKKKAPSRIWIDTKPDSGQYYMSFEIMNGVEYIRADLATPLPSRTGQDGNPIKEDEQENNT